MLIWLNHIFVGILESKVSAVPRHDYDCRRWSNLTNCALYAGLTEDHPTLTTFFEGEIIGTKHTFKTRNEAWGATEKTDMHHWARFPAWRPLAKQAKRPDFTYRNFAQREHIFMRWKEYFLVPDHRVRTISGASFEGFYYICFNQVEGTVTGIYFHAKSEKYVSQLLVMFPFLSFDTNKLVSIGTSSWSSNTFRITAAPLLLNFVDTNFYGAGQRSGHQVPRPLPSTSFFFLIASTASS